MRKIERKICALCVMLLLLCSLCGCAGRKSYTEAMQLLGLIEVETEEGETIPAKAAVEDEVYTMDADTLEAAIELLERAGKYKNAAAVLAHARQNLAYVRAVESFQRGDFSVAESAFLELEPGFAQSEKYQLAITMLSRASGTWTASVSGSPDYSEYYDDPYETAYQFYHGYTLGEGEDRDGVILMLSMSNRKYATFFYGPKAEYAFDAYGQELMEEEFLDDFRDDDWYDGFEDYLEVCDEYLARAEAGDPVRRDDSSAGGSSVSGIGTTILVCLGISAVIAMIVCLILRGKMKSVRKGTHADAYVTGSLNLTASRDQYTHTTETRTKIEHESSDSGGGGSSACSGGGGSGRSGSF